MRIGVPRETKEGERRVALLPAAAAVLVRDGHEVTVESGAGAGIAHGDASYREAGARVADARAAWSAELVVKVKELQPVDLAHLPQDRAVFGFQHLPGEPERTRALAERRATAIAFEMVRAADGSFPLLAPMSAIAGRMALGVAQRTQGKPPGRVVVLGAGHAGLAAAREAVARGAKVTVLTRSERSRDAARAEGLAAEVAAPQAIEQAVVEADLVVGAVFIPATPTPKLIPRSLVRRMKRGAMIVDVSIDAGGVAETSRPTSHAHPTFVEEGVVHYAVGNMPAAEPLEAARALSEAALPFVRALAARGIAPAVREDPALRAGVLVWKGQVNHPDIAAEAGLPYTPLSDADLA